MSARRSRPRPARGVGTRGPRRGRPRRHEEDAPAPAGYARLLAALRRSRDAQTIPTLARDLGLDTTDEPGLRRQLEKLERQGVVFSHRRGRWALHSRSHVVIGRLTSPRRTYAFVVPEDGGPDLYVAGRLLRGARHGDLVLARRRGGGRAGKGGEGEVLAVLEPRSPFLAGLFRGDGNGGVVQPRDERVSGEILVDPRDAVVTPPDGSVVWVEVTAREDRFRAARGRVVEVLGRPEAPAVQSTVIERQYELSRRFPADAESEARSVERHPSAGERAAREDFTGSAVVTVDPATARDHDDAVGLERHGTPRGGFWRLAVHIADVSHYVTEGSALDEEARRRGTSVYFPGYAIPMLPESLSSGTCSLLPGEDRLTQSVVIDLDDQGRRIARRFADGVIRSRRRMTYEETAVILAAPHSHDAISDMLRDMGRVSRLLRERRMSRGSLDLDLPETEVVVGDDGAPTGLRVVERTAAHEMIEEFMLAANEAVAGALHETAGQSLWRIHEEPDPLEIDLVEEELGAMGFPLRPTRGSPSARVRALLAAFRGRPEGPAVSMKILRALKLARYSHEAIAHFGLAAPLYTHFTSPIRRYPDLVVHRLLRRRRGAGGPGARRAAPPAGATLETLALECSRLERRAEEAERAMTEWKVAVYMKGRVGEEFHGMVTGITEMSYFVTLEGLGVEGIVPRHDGGDASRRPRGRRPARASRWRLGDRLRVRVASVDTFRPRILLRPLSTG